MRRHGTSQEGFDAEWRGIDVLTVDGDLVNRSELFDEADLDAALARFERAQPAGTAAGERGKPSARALPGALRGPRLGRHGRDAGRRLLQRRSPAGSERGNPTRSRCRDREHAGDRRSSASRSRRRASLRPAASASSSVVPASRAVTSGRGVPHRRPRHRRDRRRRADRGGRRVRPRRHRRRHRGTRRPIPRRRSGRPRAHVVGDHAGLRRAQSARASPDDTGLGEHRPPARDSVRARRPDRIHPCRMGPRARPRASTSRPCIG